MATCDDIAVDLTPVNYDVTLCSTNLDVEIIQADITLDAVSIAGSGPKGDKGDTGDPGPIGPMGPAGVGPKGDPGPAGPAGPAGADSNVPGPPGSQGPAGASGNAATISVGTTSTGAAGSPANVTNSGSSSAAVFNFSVPQGIQGATGPTGAASTVPGPPGSTGPAGSQGPQGPKGDTGATGAASTVPGPQGPQGAQGAQGPQGVIGPTGQAGLPAWTLVGGAGFTVPAYGSSVTVTVADTSWVALGEWIYVDDASGTGTAGQLVVTAKTPTTLTLFNPTANAYPLADTNQDGLLRKVSGLITDFVDGSNNCQALQPVIWSARLRSINCVSNPNFEVDQRQARAGLGNPAAGIFAQDRWQIQRVNSGTFSVNQGIGAVNLPGTSFNITNNFLTVQLATQQASLAAGDLLYLHQIVEGSQWRELSNDVHSLSLLVNSSVAGLNFSVVLRDYSPVTKSLVKLCTITSANTWQLITLSNLPLWPSGNFSRSPGVSSYSIAITLACGSTYIAPAADTWQSGTFLGAPGMSNFAASPVNSVFNIAFVQHEPGPQCTTLQDKPFQQNYDECLRYYQKTYDYGTAIGTVIASGIISLYASAATGLMNMGNRFKKPMAKAPTTTIYDHNNGAVNSVFSWPGAHCPITAIQLPSTESPFYGLTTSATLTVGQGAWAHYTADTGW